MLPTYLLSLREGLEAALIIGIVLGAVTKIRRNDLAPAVWLGTLSAVSVSILTAVILTSFRHVARRELPNKSLKALPCSSRPAS